MTAWQLTVFLGETEEELLEPVLTAPAKRKLSRPIRTALILAAVLALLALLGVAAKETGFLERLFPEKFEAIEEYVDHIAVTVENESLRLTLHEAVTDGYTVLLVYTVERLDGGSMEGWAPDSIIRAQTEEGYPLTYISSGGEALDVGECVERLDYSRYGGRRLRHLHRYPHHACHRRDHLYGAVCGTEIPTRLQVPRLGRRDMAQ